MRKWEKRIGCARFHRNVSIDMKPKMGSADLQVRETCCDEIDPFFGLCGHDSNDAFEPFNVLGHFLNEPQAHVGRDLVVSTPTSVQLASDIFTDDL